MPAQNAALYPSKRRVVSPKGERAQVRLTIDTRFTQYYFDRFISVFKPWRSPKSGHTLSLQNRP
jgi:hypothetical protein